MAFRATNTIPQRAYLQGKQAAINLQRNCLVFVQQLAATGASYSLMRDIYLTLKNAKAQFNTLKTVPGLMRYAQEQEDDVEYDLLAEFTALQAAIDAVLAAIENNAPVQVTPVAPAEWTVDGPLIATTYSVAQTQPLRTLLQACADSIV